MGTADQFGHIASFVLGNVRPIALSSVNRVTGRLFEGTNPGKTSSQTDLDRHPFRSGASIRKPSKKIALSAIQLGMPTPT